MAKDSKPGSKDSLALECEPLSKHSLKEEKRHIRLAFEREEKPEVNNLKQSLSNIACERKLSKEVIKKEVYLSEEQNAMLDAFLSLGISNTPTKLETSGDVHPIINTPAQPNVHRGKLIARGTRNVESQSLQDMGEVASFRELTTALQNSQRRNEITSVADKDEILAVIGEMLAEETRDEPSISRRVSQHNTQNSSSTPLFINAPPTSGVVVRAQVVVAPVTNVYVINGVQRPTAAQLLRRMRPIRQRPR